MARLKRATHLSLESPGSPAPLWRRSFAYVIDLLILSLVILLPLSGLYEDFPEDDFKSFLASLEETPSLSLILVEVLIAILSVFYWTVLEYYTGQSVGKILMGIKVKSLSGLSLNFGQAFMRNVVKFSTFLLLLDLLYGVIKRNNRRCSEVISNTYVVSTGMRDHAC